MKNAISLDFIIFLKFRKRGQITYKNCLLSKILALLTLFPIVDLLMVRQGFVELPMVTHVQLTLRPLQVYGQMHCVSAYIPRSVCILGHFPKGRRQNKLLLIKI